MFEIERVRDKERKIGYSLHKRTETLVRDRERFEIEGVRDRESQLYVLFIFPYMFDYYFYEYFYRITNKTIRNISNLISNSILEVDEMIFYT